ncbi:MAG: hypothetical protein ACRD6X_18175 [Pyrinomonadaceae bacterium]
MGAQTARAKIDRLFVLWDRSRGYRTLIMMLLPVALYFGARFYLGDKLPAQLRFVDSAAEHPNGLVQVDGQRLKPVFSGAPFETASRLRESGALLMAVSLICFEEFQKYGRFPTSVHPILAGLQKRSLLPPGIEVRDGGFRSALSELILNYRSEPFAFEIFALPTSTAPGPAILFRFPLPPGEANSIMYFRSPAGSTPIIPQQFSTTDQLGAVGWSIRQWRGEALPLDQPAIRDLQEHDIWLKSIISGK